ncbi:hypothetical protein [Pectobacterium parmentieri]|uniref:CD-NTase-associated protein 15 domain-containing protein n=1 Tax=Pectobacterium parmentieri TaxID=1905730 RepID=A0A8B3G2S9_PECPM|nr:hypothetical protein [Pectobacterium parmentieri]AOR57591.1 hypothetical protein A8F97_01515 [Pectobacterium parmentieri]AYH11378.1 hypothetical protein C5E24_17635 [Pectobacterium parmentieri]AYH17905.1 hypothetical protein C5E22_05150 [Pectobacterium parmentieri]AYH37657.1 hypothetical protein C5E17_17365 [Pectobacterium parmentieri]AZS57888.1 hypothetical protein C5E18_18055 [Pectobacterium parmentieri]
MWDLLPLKIKYGTPAAISIVVYSFFSEYLSQPFFRSISYTITTITVLAWISGKYLWKYFYIDYLKNNFCPDFNGQWIGSIESNYNGNTKIEFPIEIEASFFSIKMKGTTTIGRTYSNYCKIFRTEDDCFELHYMFKVFNDTPSVTDESFYEGAARLRVTDIKTMSMKGVFWTNRCWQNGENTAGVIKFEKKN